MVRCVAVRTHGRQFYGYHQKLMRRRGYKRALVATAHKMLRIIYAMLRDHRPYRDPKADYIKLGLKAKAPRWIRVLKELGYLQQQEDGTYLYVENPT